MVKVWYARDSVVKVAEAISSIPTDAALDTATEWSSGYALHAVGKNITITEPEGSIDKIDLLGEDANNFQNAELDKKPFGLAKISGTLILDGDETLETYAYGSGTTISTTHTRYQAGDGSRTACAFLVNLDDGTNEVNIVLNNAYITKIGDRKITADGHWEVDFEAVCLPKDYYVEFKD